MLSSWDKSWDITLQKNNRNLYISKKFSQLLEREVPMYKFMRIQEFAKPLFGNTKEVRIASQIMLGMITAQSPRISDIADAMAGEEAANRKQIYRFLKGTDTQSVLKYLYNEEADIVIADPTEIERPGAKKTSYVGTLSDGQTRGFWMLTLATPLRGRAIPCHFVTYSSETIGEEGVSRNLEHQRAVQGIKDLIGNKPMVFDREFSYQGFLESLHAEEIDFVIRLRLGANAPRFFNAEGREIQLLIAQNGKPKTFHQLTYRGEIPVNIFGIWQPGFKKPLWIMTSLSPEEGYRIYQLRAKIETSFRDLKTLLNVDKIMNKSKFYLEKVLALFMIAYTIAMLIGEAIRDIRYDQIDPDSLDLLCSPDEHEHAPKWHSFSGLFILLKRRRRLDASTLRKIVYAVSRIFLNLIDGNVSSFVPT
jgi:hypothetical protein